MANDDFVAPVVSFPDTPALPKIAREGLVLIAVEAELSPLVVQQILAIIHDRDATAFTITVQRNHRIQCIALEIAAPGERGAALLLQDLRRLRNVRQARVGFPPHASGLPIAAKL